MIKLNKYSVTIRVSLYKRSTILKLRFGHGFSAKVTYLSISSKVANEGSHKNIVRHCHIGLLILFGLQMGKVG